MLIRNLILYMQLFSGICRYMYYTSILLYLLCNKLFDDVSECIWEQH